MPIHELYAQLKGRITMREGMEDLDRNSQEFETVFKKLCSSKNDQVGMGRFMFLNSQSQIKEKQTLSLG